MDEDAETRLQRATQIVRDLASEEPCQFDHNGDCQEHGYFSTTLEEEYTCPHLDAKRFLAEIPQEVRP